MARKQLAFYGSFHGIKFDKASFSKTFEAKAQVLVRNAAREWLRAVLTKVPIWTGMSRGSIVLAKGKVGGVGLARYLNMAIPTPHPNSRPKWYYPNPGSKYRLPKTPETGGQRGEYAFPSTQHRYRFRYTNNVIQVGIGELFGTQKAGLWGAQDAGNDAFKRYIQEHAKSSLPTVRDFLKTGEVVFLSGSEGI